MTTCPYCNKKIEIDHDDGYGYEEDERHEQQCDVCGKTFVYLTYISFYYETRKAPCLNNEREHNFIRKPLTNYPNYKVCQWCDTEEYGNLVVSEEFK